MSTLTNTRILLSALDTERFLKKIDMMAGPEECWPWKGKPNKEGRGRFTANGITDYAYRWMMVAMGNTLEEGDVVNHLCSNPLCVRPTHLEITDQAGNAHHMVNSDRGPHAKLKYREVVRIRREWAAPDRPLQRDIASKYGVSRAAISKVVNGKTWRSDRQK